MSAPEKHTVDSLVALVRDTIDATFLAGRMLGMARTGDSKAQAQLTLAADKGREMFAAIRGIEL